jgi:hypothetical protein
MNCGRATLVTRRHLKPDKMILIKIYSRGNGEKIRRFELVREGWIVYGIVAKPPTI